MCACLRCGRSLCVADTNDVAAAADDDDDDERID
jgi:hypothetical protein